MSDLKPCPFCGGRPIILSTDKTNVLWEVKCLDCHARGRMTPGGKARAIELWNARPSEDKARAEALEEAVGAIEKLKNHTAIEPHTSRFIILNLVLSTVKELNHDR